MKIFKSNYQHMEELPYVLNRIKINDMIVDIATPRCKIISSVILVHPLSNDRHIMMHHIAPRLCAAGFVCVAFDLPGHGFRVPTTLWAPGDQQKTLEVANNIAKAVSDILTIYDYIQHSYKSINLFGYSLGSYIACLAATMINVDHLIIASTGIRKYIVDDLNLYKHIGAPISNKFSIEHAAKKIKVPTLILNGLKDTIVPFETAEQLSECFKHKKFMKYDADHSLCDKAWDDATTWLVNNYKGA